MWGRPAAPRAQRPAPIAFLDVTARCRFQSRLIRICQLAVHVTRPSVERIVVPSTDSQPLPLGRDREI